MTQSLLERLEVQQLRVLQDVSVTLSPGLNVLAGPNGSGKTSFLEALHVLGTGHSFRSRRLRELIARGHGWLRVRGDVRAEGEGTRSIGLEYVDGAARIRLAGQEVKTASTLAKVLPLVVVWPESYRLLTDGASERRRVMDWTLFHVEQDYLAVHQRFRRLARQRNVLLRSHAPATEREPWTAELAEAGERLHRLRAGRLAEILPAVSRYVEELCSVEVEITYQPGWDTEQALANVLAGSESRDLARGYSDAGPQRADLKLTVGGRPAHQVLSRGEGKMFVVALLMGQAHYLATALARRPIVLMDELASELDAANRERVLSALGSMETQCFLTTVSADLVQGAVANASMAVFHVEHGDVQPQG